jgi:hypothetical protein
VPAAPTSAISGTDVTITWVAPTDGGSAITGYTVAIQQSDANFATAICNVVSITCTTICTCSVTIASLQAAPYSIVAGGSVFAKVLATNSSGNSVYSSSGNGAILPYSSAPSVPAAPTTAI